MACLFEQTPDQFLGNGIVACSEDNCPVTRVIIGDGWDLHRDLPLVECIESTQTVGRVLSVTEDQHGVTAQIRLAPGWTAEKIEEKLRHFFWGGPDDFDFNTFVTTDLPTFPTPGPLRLQDVHRDSELDG
jgi:hypothetical protein